MLNKLERNIRTYVSISGVVSIIFYLVIGLGQIFVLSLIPLLLFAVVWLLVLLNLFTRRSYNTRLWKNVDLSNVSFDTVGLSIKEFFDESLEHNTSFNSNGVDLNVFVAKQVKNGSIGSCWVPVLVRTQGELPRALMQNSGIRVMVRTGNVFGMNINFLGLVSLLKTKEVVNIEISS